YSLRVGATQHFDHRGLANLESRTKPLIEDASRPNGLPSERVYRTACLRERFLQLARDDDRRTVIGGEIKINARAPKANPAHPSLDHDELSVASTERRRLERRDDGVIRIAPDSKACAPRAVFDDKAGGCATARLELWLDARMARSQQGRRSRLGRGRRVARGFGGGKVRQRALPAVCSVGQEVEFRLAADKASGKKVARRPRRLRIAALRFGRIQTAEPDEPTVGQGDVEPLVDGDDLNGSGRRAAVTEGGRGKTNSRADQNEPDVGSGGGAPQPFAKSVRGAEIHAMAFPAPRARVLPGLEERKRVLVPVAQQDRAQVS